MIRLIMLFFALLTAGAAAATYYNVGLEDTKYETASSVRSGSAGVYVGGGGYRYGK